MISKEISSALGECVIAPTEMKSTPVFAAERIFFKVIPPDASILTVLLRDLIMATAFFMFFVDILSSRIMSAPASIAFFTCERVFVSISTLPFLFARPIIFLISLTAAI